MSGAYRPATATTKRGTGGNPGGPQNPKNSKGKKKGGPWRVVFWVALVVFIGAVGTLGVIGYSYLQGQNMYKDVANEAFVPSENVPLEDMKVDWDALKAKNPETVGWIYVPGTVINYPIVHTTDNEKYLTTDFLGEKGWLANFGTIFLAAENKADFSDANNIVYGHHMNDGSMFAAFDTFRNADEFNGHRVIYILTPAGNYKLNTFSLVICGANDPLAQPTFTDKAEMQRYIQDKINRSVVMPAQGPASPDGMDKIFAFVTCDYTINDGRAVLFASVVESTVPSSPASQGQGSTNIQDVSAVGNAAKEI